MIDLRDLDAFRDRTVERFIAGSDAIPSSDVGAFQVPSPIDGEPLRCVVSSGRAAVRSGLPPWDHVSVSRVDRTPWWEEMDAIARLFFREHEHAMQLHVPYSEHVNLHPNCLHIWRPAGMKKIPLPPSSMVGPDSFKGRAKKA